jgi:hypothetical protein
MRPLRAASLAGSLAALTLAIAALSLSTPSRADMPVVSADKISPSVFHRVSGRCPDGFHEVGAPNGNGYWCRENGW